MLAAQAPDIDGLETSDSSVILHLHSGEVLKHGGYLLRSHWLLGEVNLLRSPDYGTCLDSVHGNRRQRIRLLGREAPRDGKKR